jgi:mannose-6-phosphate isomerase-like protein (cupin superfamily)
MRPLIMKITSLEKIKEEPVSHSPKIKKRVLVKKGEMPHLTNFSQAYYKPGQIASEHTHEDVFEAFLVEQGTGLIKVNGKVNKLKKGDCVLVEPGEAHEIINTGSEVLILTYFGIEK